jgi:predicted DNA-binding protein
MTKPDIYITFRVVQEEKEILRQYCDQVGRQQSDVMREFIRSLKKKIQK